MAIEITPLGAGQDVGRSCILVKIGNKQIMLDCGMHMGYNDERKFPDFTHISMHGNFTKLIDCVIISHFHLDHCGALPYFTEVMGYDGPVYMSHPTKAIIPILLEDFMRIISRSRGPKFDGPMIQQSLAKVIPMQLHQSVFVGGDPDFEIKTYYAGHVLGAAMFYIRVGSESLVYTGDFNMTPDQHLGSAWIDTLKPDCLITESTYGTTIRDSKRSRERDFLKKVHDCVNEGGKVLIPCFALGRAQELCLLIDSYWERMGLQNVPVYYSAGLSARATEYYKLFINWTNEKVKSTFVERNMFAWKHIKEWDRSFAGNPGPMVVFATPGMLHQGNSLLIFREFAPNPKNMIIMPGYCSPGTIGHQVLSGADFVMIDGQRIPVNLQVRNLSFSAHADAKGIMQLIRHCGPKHVVLVHGDLKVMIVLQQKVESEIGVPCLYPANGQTITIHTPRDLPATISTALLKAAMAQYQKQQQANQLSLTPNPATYSSDVTTPYALIPMDVSTNITPASKGTRLAIDGVTISIPQSDGTQRLELVSHEQHATMVHQQPSALQHRPSELSFRKEIQYPPSVFAQGGVWCPMQPLDAVYLSIHHDLKGSDLEDKYPLRQLVDSVTIASFTAKQDTQGNKIVIHFDNDHYEFCNRFCTVVNLALEGTIRPIDCS